MTQFENLVFEGGGVKGIAYAGATAVLEKKGVLAGIRRVAGTSTGAAMATLLALGADTVTLNRIVSTTPFNTFEDATFGFFPNVWRLLTSYGWFKGDAFAAWIKKQIAALAGEEALSFAALAKRAQSEPQRFRELYMIATDLSAQRAVVYSAENTPDVPIWLAARASMSIPLLFASVKRAGEVWADGGISWNYPIELFDRVRYVNAAGGNSEIHSYNPATLGFRVGTRAQIGAEEHGFRAPPVTIGNFIAYVKALIGFTIDIANRAHLEPEDWQRTVFIDSHGIGATDFSIDATGISTLIESGRLGTEVYFEWLAGAGSKMSPA